MTTIREMAPAAPPNYSFIQRDLEAGTYYVVSEGYGQNGEIQTNITTHVNEFGYTDSPNPYSSEPEGVGSTAGSFDVSPTGAATFSIPIEVSPGVGGMQPSIAIAYNSQAGNGVAGWGCGIAGISAITRAPKTIYHDSQASGITHGLADAFVLDGQRLVYDNWCGVSEGKAGAVYHPENDPLTKITVYLPVFSQTSYSPSVNFTHSSSNKYSFKSADMNGDGISDLIQITSYPDQNIPNLWDQRVRIHLGSIDSNGNTQFTAGTEYLMDFFNAFYARENCIPVDFDGIGNCELLIPVSKYIQSKACLEFKFIEGSMHNRTFTHDFKYTSNLNDVSGWPVYASGDMNNDGKDDFIFIEKVHNGSNMYPCVIAAHDPENANILKWGKFDLNLTSKPEKMFIADFNGDGLNDIMIFYTGGYKLFWNQGNDISNQTFSNSIFETGTNIKNVNMIRMGDFNGDGLSDFFLCPSDAFVLFCLQRNSLFLKI